MPRKLFKPGQAKPPRSGRVKGTPNKWTKVKRSVLAEMIDPDRALREAARLAYSDARELFDERGNLKPVTDWPDDLASAVASIEVVKKNLAAGDDKVDDVIKVRLWDKPKNIELLFKHLGLLVEKVQVGGELVVRWQG